MSRLTLTILLALVSQLGGCRKEQPSAALPPAPAKTLPTTAQRIDPTTTKPASPTPSAVASDAGEPVVAGFRIVKTRWDFSAGGPTQRDQRPPTLEPELAVQRSQQKAQHFKVFPCAPKQMASPAYNICVEFAACRELGAAESKEFAPALPNNVRAVVACARSPNGPVHLLALRVVDNAVVVELSRSDPDKLSPLKDPLCATCPNIRLRHWEETRRVQVDFVSELSVEAATQTERRVVGIRY